MALITNTPPPHIPLFRKPETREIETVFLHCSASGRPEHARIDVIENWHRQRGFDEIGYHYFIDFDGEIWHGRDLEKIPAAQKGHNTGSIAICLAGLRPSDFRLIQLDALLHLCHEIDWAYAGNITFHGHNEVSDKSCPVFDYRHYLKLDDAGHLNGSREPITKPMQVFDQGVDVVHLQRQLNKWLSENGRRTIPIDGAFGNMTAQAVVEFQQENDLPITGMVDSITKLQLPFITYGRI